MLSNLIWLYAKCLILRSLFRKKSYIDQIEQITQGMLIAQKTKLINYQLMFLKKAFQPKAHNQGTL